MKHAALLLTGLMVSLAHAQQNVQFAAPDGVQVQASYFALEHPRGAIVLLKGATLDVSVPAHERCNYGDLPGKLQQMGYAVLNVDLRVSNHNAHCFTPTQAPISDVFEAMQDLDAAVAWLQAKTSLPKVVLMGSGFSSMMALHEALLHPEWVQGVLSFAPGSKDIDQTEQVALGLKHFTVPVLMVAPANEMGLAENIQMGLPAGLGEVVAAPEVENEPLGSGLLGFEEPTTRAVYEQAAFDFLEQLPR